MKKMLRSKRFISFILSFIAYILICIFSTLDPVSVATGLSMLSLIYIGAESYRKSDSKEV